MPLVRIANHAVVVQGERAEFCAVIGDEMIGRCEDIRGYERTVGWMIRMHPNKALKMNNTTQFSIY